jgi:hypothetical protein
VRNSAAAEAALPFPLEEIVPLATTGAERPEAAVVGLLNAAR